MKKLRTAIIGCGGIAGAHARELATMEGVELAAFCDIEENRAKEFSERFAQGAAAIYADYGEMYAKEDLNLVYICLPPFAHGNEVELAAKNGVHVFIEKPIALDMNSASRMARAAARAGIKTQVGFVLRFGEAVQKAKALIEGGECGRVALMTARYMCKFAATSWWRDKSKSGGQIVEQIIHIYDLARYLVGEPRSVVCRLDNLLHTREKDYGVEDTSSALITFRSGAIGSISAINGAIPTRWLHPFELVAEKRTILFDDMNNATVYFTDQGWSAKADIRSDKPCMRAEALDLINAIRTDGQTVAPIEEGVKTLRLVLAARESGETGKEVQL
jgi:predicted dehydrogenase